MVKVNEDVEIKEVPMSWLQDEFSGFEFVEELVEEPMITELYDFEYDFLLKRAMELGFIGGRKPKAVLIDYIEGLDIGVDDLIEFPRPQSFLTSGVRKKYCVPAVGNIEAKLIIEGLGNDDMEKNKIPCNGWWAVDIRVEHPDTCGITVKWKTRQYYERRLQRAIQRLRDCPPGDDSCLRSAMHSIKYHRNRIDKYPFFARQKCFCGNFECLQSDIAVEKHRETLVKRRKIRRLASQVRGDQKRSTRRRKVE